MAKSTMSPARRHATRTLRARTSLGVQSCPTSVTGSSATCSRRQPCGHHRHRKDRERLVVSLGGGRPQVMSSARDHSECLAVAAFHVHHLGDVPTAVGRHGAAWLDAYRLARPRKPAEPSSVGRPVEMSIRPPIVDGHAAADVDLGERHTAPAAPVAGERDHVDRDALRADSVQPAGQMGVQPAQSQSPEGRAAACRSSRGRPGPCRTASGGLPSREPRRAAPRPRGAAGGGALGVRRARQVNPQQHLDVTRRRRPRPRARQAELVRAFHVHLRAEPDRGWPAPPRSCPDHRTPPRSRERARPTCPSSPPEETSSPSVCATKARSSSGSGLALTA